MIVMTPSSTQLIIDSSEKNADLFYATRFIAPDPFALVEIRGKKYLLISDLEIDRAKKESCVKTVISTSKLALEYKTQFRKIPTLVDIVEHFLKKHRIRKILVPGSFPVQFQEFLQHRGFKIHHKRSPFYEKRLIKSRAEIKSITDTLHATERAFAKALQALKRSTIKKSRLYDNGKPLTSESLRKIIHHALLDEGCIGAYTIVACGKQTADPHQRGSGPLLAHQPIIIDIFPRNEKTFYHADFTRTVVRGKASAKLKKMYAAVWGAQKIAFKMIHSGAAGKKIHCVIQDLFSQLGFRTGLINGRMQGFFHSTGHGLGLEIHEAPHISFGKDVLKAGEVVTVEPGLYYKNTGGVRLEDVVVVTRSGCKNLTRFPKQLEI